MKSYLPSYSEEKPYSENQQPTEEQDDSLTMASDYSYNTRFSSGSCAAKDLLPRLSCHSSRLGGGCGGSSSYSYQDKDYMEQSSLGYSCYKTDYGGAPMTPTSATCTTMTLTSDSLVLDSVGPPPLDPMGETEHSASRWCDTSIVINPSNESVASLKTASTLAASVEKITPSATFVGKPEPGKKTSSSKLSPRKTTDRREIPWVPKTSCYGQEDSPLRPERPSSSAFQQYQRRMPGPPPKSSSSRRLHEARRPRAQRPSLQDAYGYPGGADSRMSSFSGVSFYNDSYHPSCSSSTLQCRNGRGRYGGRENNYDEGMRRPQPVEEEEEEQPRHRDRDHHGDRGYYNAPPHHRRSPSPRAHHSYYDHDCSKDSYNHHRCQEQQEKSHRRPSPPPPPPPPPTAANVTMIEIEPGVTAPLRGAAETTEAVAHDFIARRACWGCQEDIYCVADCQWVLCPQCRFISPMEDEQELPNSHGLGLGLTCQTLWAMQEEQQAQKQEEPEHYHHRQQYQRYHHGY